MNTKTEKEVPEGYFVLQRSAGKADYSVCLDGGKWHGWLFKKGAESNQWVSDRKLEQWEVMQAEDQRDDNIVHEIVANKAEVDLSSLNVQTGADIELVYCNRDEEFVRLDDVKALLATPPATTGASTAQRPTDDELWDATIRDRDAYHEWADNLAYAIAVHFDVDIGEHSNQNLPWAEALEVIENAERVGASTVLTDERKPFAYVKFCAHEQLTSEGDVDSREWYEFCEAHEIGDDKLPAFPVYDQPVREVAAKAGQVAVPGWISIDERLPEFRHECTSSGCEVSDPLMVYGQNEFGTTGCGFGHARDDGTWATYEAEYDQLSVVKVTHWMPLPSAPSPAKESK